MSNIKKAIIIDEAELLTEITQEALRRTIEKYSNNVRFVFICTYPSKIIEAIQSRCVILKFKSTSETIIIRNIIRIFYEEKILFSILGLESIIFSTEGDMRRLLNESELIGKCFLKITDETLKLSCFTPDTFMIGEFLYYIFNKNSICAFEIFIDICNEGNEFIEIIDRIFRFLKKVQLIGSRKFKILKILCEFQIGFFCNQSRINNMFSILKQLICI
jgi:DNA polymerase III gamma/tau subunit